MPKPPLTRSGERSTCVNISNTRGSISAGMPFPLSRTATSMLSPARSARSWIRPPVALYFAALFSRLAKTWVSRTGSPSTVRGSAGSTTSRSLAALFDQGHARFHRAGEGPGQIDLLAAQVDRAARDARDLEQVVDETHHLIDLPFDHLADVLGDRVAAARRPAGCAPSCGWARADCAARARESPGTRPCGGRPRATPARSVRVRPGARGSGTAALARAVPCAPRSPAQRPASAAPAP